MKLNVFLNGFVFLFILFFSTYSWALYPEKEGYPSKKDNLGIYVGLGIGTSVSNTFGLASKEDFVSLYAPTKSLAGGLSLATLGIRLYDFRFEGEYSNFYQWYSVINDQALHTSAISSTSLPTKGQEALTGFAFNSYYDFRFISNTFYPYIGFGVGSSSARYVSIDEFKQPNGLGENYSANKQLGFYQLMIGMQYDLKVVKSSFSVEYRFMKAQSLTVTPSNDGLHDIAGDSYLPGGVDSLYPNAGDWVEPTDKNITPVFHSIVFTLKYYLY